MKFGFSYIGVIWLIMLFVPNMIWTKNKPQDYEKYDLFVGMDSANIRNMHRLFGGDPDGKIKKLMDYSSRGGDVDDPWYSGRFEVTYRDIYEGCEAMLERLKCVVESKSKM